MRFRTWREDPETGVKKISSGIDMAAPSDMPVYPAMSGQVADVGHSDVYDNYVVINHGNQRQTFYGYLSQTFVKKGQTITQNDQIGIVGDRGNPALHFAAYQDERAIDPVPLVGTPWTKEEPEDEGGGIFAIYGVEEGDTLFSIAQEYGVSVDDLIAVNELSGDRVIKAGDVLKIPMGK
jgi:murein DD-endopeptidase MepM/ murein hydrolase activator NlpD